MAKYSVGLSNDKTLLYVEHELSLISAINAAKFWHGTLRSFGATDGQVIVDDDNLEDVVCFDLTKTTEELNV